MVRAKRLWSGIIICFLIGSLTIYPINYIVSGQDEQPTVEDFPTETSTVIPDTLQPLQEIDTTTACSTPSPTGISHCYADSQANGRPYRLNPVTDSDEWILLSRPQDG
jgi:hypothetical protein